MTHVTKSDKNEQKKLTRILAWLRQARGNIRFEGEKIIYNLLTWKDAAFTVCDKVKNQTGCTMPFGHLFNHCRSNKQRLSTKSSTMERLFGTSENVPSTMCLATIMEAKGYPINKYAVFQTLRLP